MYKCKSMRNQRHSFKSLAANPCICLEAPKMRQQALVHSTKCIQKNPPRIEMLRNVWILRRENINIKLKTQIEIVI